MLGQDQRDLGGSLAITSAATPASGVGRYPLTPLGARQRQLRHRLPAPAPHRRPRAAHRHPGAAAALRQRHRPLHPGLRRLRARPGPKRPRRRARPRHPAGIASDAGRYPLTASGLSSANYAIAYAPGTLTVDPAPLTVTANDAARRYGGADPDFTARFDGFVLGQDQRDLAGSLAVASAATPASGVGRYPLTPSGLASGNYAIAYRPGTLTVDPAPLTVTPAGSRSYGSATARYTPGFDGFVLGQGQSDLAGALDYATPAGIASDAGRYPLTASGLSSANYAIAYAPGTLTVDPAPLTVTANDAARRYGGADPDFTARFDGFVLGQDQRDLAGSLAVASAATPASGVGRYAPHPLGARQRQLRHRLRPGTLTVDPAPLTVTPAEPQLRQRHRPLHPGLRRLRARRGPSDLAGALDYATPAGIASDAGRYPLTASGLSSANYAIAYAPGTLTVDPAPLTVTANDAARRYGGADPDFTARFDGFVLGQDQRDLAGSLAVASAASPASGVGRYPLTPSGLASGNYAIAYAPAPSPRPRAAHRHPGRQPQLRQRHRPLHPGLDGFCSARTRATSPARSTSPRRPARQRRRPLR